MDWQAVADDQPLLIGAMFVVMLALESARPLIDWSDGRWSHLRRNLGLTLVAFLGFGLAGMAKLAVAQWATDHRVGVLHLFALPLPLRFLASFALIDLADYVLHRAQHAVPFIWRVHRVHHADPHLDASSSLRFHPLDGVLQNAYQAVLLPILGIQLDAMIAFDTLLLVARTSNTRTSNGLPPSTGCCAAPSRRRASIGSTTRPTRGSPTPTTATSSRSGIASSGHAPWSTRAPSGSASTSSPMMEHRR